MIINWSDILGQVIAWAIVGVIGLILSVIIRRFQKSKNWFGKNWLIIVGSLAIGYVIYRIYTLDKSFSTGGIAIVFVSAIYLFIMFYYVKSYNFTLSTGSEILQKQNSDKTEVIKKIDGKIAQVKSEINDLKVSILLIEVKEWETKKVLANIFITYLQILDIADPTSYAFEKTLDGLEDVLVKMKEAKEKVDAYRAGMLRNALKNSPDQYSDIVKRILANL